MHEATGYPVAVAFNAGNLLSVAKLLRAKFPAIKLVVCGDRDESGTGQKAAQAAALAVHGLVVLPNFQDGALIDGKPPSDFNDLHRLQGLGAVVDAVHEALAAASEVSADVPRGYASVNLVCAAEVKERPISWLWPGWVARGKLTILAGAAGTGKTTLALGLAATVTTAGRWPDGASCQAAGNVLVWSSEDDPADTLKPRLMAAGANIRKAFFIQGVTDDNGDVLPFDPGRDIPMLYAAVDRIGGASLLLVDPIVSAVAGDMHRANDVRRSLQALVDFAEANQCAVLGISHFAKGGAGSTPQDRVIGSQAFGALARTVLVAAKQEDGTTRVLARAKSNIGLDDGGVSYTIEAATVGASIDTTRVVWGEHIEGTAREILGEVEATVDEAVDPVEDSTDALARILRPGAIHSRQVKALMKENGFTEKQIRTARERLGVSVIRDGFGASIKTYWSLPGQGVVTTEIGNSPFVPSDAHSCPEKSVGTNGEKGHEWKKPVTSSGEVEGQL